MYVRLKLGKSRYTIVDRNMIEKISKYRWYAQYNSRRNRTDVFALINNIHTSLGRYLLDLNSEMEVDHINRDPLDNRLCNLRICNVSQNCINKPPRNNKKFKGVYKTKYGNYSVSVNNKYYGRYKTIEEAAKIYDSIALKIYGEFAYLNFPVIDMNIVKDPDTLELIDQNLINGKLTKRNKSGYFNVYKYSSSKWKAMFVLNNQLIDLGQYNTPEKAALVYDDYILSHPEIKKPLNFPEIEDRPVFDLNLSDRKSIISTNSSGYRGVQWDKQRNNWKVKNVINGKCRYKFNFKTKLEAALHYDTIEEMYRKTNIVLNFPSYISKCNIIVNDIIKLNLLVKVQYNEQ